MSFSSGGGFGGAGEALTYFIKAYDTATPIFRAFGAEVEAVTKKVQASLTEMNRMMVAQSRTVAGSAAEQQAALTKIEKAQTAAASSSARSSKVQSDSAKNAAKASNEQALSAQRAADRQIKAAAETSAAFGRSEAAISRYGGRIILATVAAAGASLDFATKFQANSLRMETQAGATAKGLDQIRQGLLKMAGEVGSTPDQLASGMYHIVSSMNAILPPATRVSQELKIMKLAAEGAQVGHSNLEETTYALASAMNALHLQANSASMVMGQLNAIVGAGDMTMSDLINSFKSGIIPAAKTFGISLQSVGAALAVMGDMGMRGAISGTRLRMAISLLAAPTQQAAKILETLGMSSGKALATTHAMSKALEKAGINVSTLSDDLRKPDGLAVALKDLNDHMQKNGLSADAAGAAIDRAFGGGRMGATIKLLAENTDRLKIKFDQIGVSGKQFGTDWHRASETFRVQLDKALAAVEAFGIKIGTKLLPYATDALHTIEDTVGWLGKHDAALKILGGTIITFSSVAIGSFFIGKMRQALGLMKSFGTGIASAGRWMFGVGGGGGAGPTTGGIAGTGSPLAGGLYGYMGSTIRVGTMMNPIAVTMAGAGLAGGAASQTEANLQKAAGAGPAVVASEASASRQANTELDAALARMQAQSAARAGTAMVGASVVGPEMNAFLSRMGRQQESLIARASGVPAGVMTQSQFAQALSTPRGAGMGTATASIALTPAEEALLAGGGGIGLAGMKTMITSGLSSLLKGGAIAGVGALGSNLVGGLVGGSTGHAISTIGTTASIGAGLGSFVGPMGTAIGGALGAAMGVAIELFKKEDYGKKLASSLTKGFGGVQAPALKSALQQALDAAKAITDSGAPKGIPGARGPLITGGVGGPTPLTPEQIQKREGDFQRAGHLLANALEKGWAQYKFQSEPVMFNQLVAETKKMPPQVRAVAIESALAFTQTLIKQGKLPADAANQFLAQAERQFPNFQKYLGLSAQASVATFTKQFDFSQAEANLKDTMSRMRGDFPAVTAAMDNTAGDVGDKAKAMVRALKDIAASGSGPAKKLALADLAALSKGAGAELGKLVSEASTSAGDMKKAISSNSAQAFQIGSSNFAGLAKNIGNAMGGGAEATKQGIQNITDQVNAALKGLGEKALSPLTVASLTPAQLAAVASGQVSSGAAASPHATGGRVPGAIGGDNYTIMDPLGRAVGRVGGGELLIANQHSEADISYATRMVYNKNLGEMVTGEHRSHTGLSGAGFATGGLSPSALLNNPGTGTKSAPTGGYVYPIGPGAHDARIDQGKDFTGNFIVSAIGPGSVIRDTLWSGWPGTGGVVYRLTAGPRAGSNVFQMEHQTALVHTGQSLSPGQPVTQSHDGYPWLEIGWANSAGTGPLTPYNGKPDGTPMPGGIDFANFIAGLAHGKITGASVASGVGGSVSMPAAVWKKLIAPHVGGSGIPTALAQGAINKVTAVANVMGEKKVKAHNASGNLGSFSGQGGSSSANQALGHQMMLAAGFPEADWPSLQALWTQESGWSSTAVNHSSGAYGIPQSLGHGHPYNLGDAAAQIAWGLNYIKGRYGNPIAAEAHERAFNWYNTGGRVPGYFGGGFVPGDPYSDSTLIAASGNEFMMTGHGQQLMEMAAPGLLGHIAASQMPHFQGGGFVGDVTKPAYPGASVGRGPGGRFVHLPGHHNKTHHHHSSSSSSGGSHSGSRAVHTTGSGYVKMYDGTAGGDINAMPKNAPAVASYLDNHMGYSQARKQFPNAAVVSISVQPGNNISADIYDIEPMGKTVGETSAAIKAGKAKGAYGGAGVLAALRKSLGGVSTAYWLADWNTGPVIPGGYDAHQYQAPGHGSPGPYDVSVARPSFFTKLGKPITGSAATQAAARKAATTVTTFEPVSPGLIDGFSLGYEFGLNPLGGGTSPEQARQLAAFGASLKAVQTPIPASTTTTASTTVKGRKGKASTKGPASGWIRTGATLDSGHGSQGGGAGEFAWHGGMSFAELLERGANAGMRPDLTALLGLPRTTSYGAPYGTPILARAIGSNTSYKIWKSDVGSGQGGSGAHYTTDLHDAISQKLHFGGKGDIEVHHARRGGFIGGRKSIPRFQTGGPISGHYTSQQSQNPFAGFSSTPSPYAHLGGARLSLGRAPNTVPTASVTSLQQALAQIPVDAVNIGVRTTKAALKSLTAALTTISSTPNNAKIRAAMGQLSAVLNNVGTMSYGTLEKTASAIQKQITGITTVTEHHTRIVTKMIDFHGHKVRARVAEHYTTKSPAKLTRGQEHEVTRLKQALQLVEYQEGLRVGIMVKTATDQAAALSGANTRLQRMMARQGISDTSAQGAQMLQAFDNQAVVVLKSTVADLKKAYQLAQKAGDQKTMADITDKLGTAMDQLDQAVTDSILQKTAVITATAQGFSDFATRLGGVSDLMSSLQGLSSGTNLGALGLTSDVLATMGIDSNQAQGLVGSGMDNINKLAQQQGGVLTAAQIASAQQGVTAANAGLKAQEVPLAGELAYYQSQLPNLTGQARNDAVTAMLGLAKQIAGLEQGISSNTDALAALTQATNANTSATGQMTGSVTYSYQGQNYLAGLGLSSEQISNLSVGG